jgi:hypothetical protein
MIFSEPAVARKKSGDINGNGVADFAFNVASVISIASGRFCSLIRPCPSVSVSAGAG